MFDLIDAKKKGYVTFDDYLEVYKKTFNFDWFEFFN